MAKEDIVVSPKAEEEDSLLDLTLRPKKMIEFVGQEKTKRNLKIHIVAVQKRKESLDHILLYGPPGLGKTTLAYIIAHEAKTNVRTTSGPALERVGDLGSILTNLSDGDILFIDEIHRLNRVVEEVLYPAMEEFVLDIVIGKGPSAKTVRLNLPRFTIIGATTRIGLISSPMRDRFGIVEKLGYYKPEEIKQIILRSAKILGIEVDRETAGEVALCSRQTPRVANRLLKRIRDFCEVKGSKKITKELADKTLNMLEVDSLGLDATDRRILKMIIDRFQGGPVGLETIATCSQEEIETVSEVYEPFLLQIGFLDRTPRGRVVTRAAYKHLGYKGPKDKGENEQKKLF